MFRTYVRKWEELRTQGDRDSGTNMVVIGILILRNSNEAWKLCNLARYHGIIPRGCGINFRIFDKSSHVDYLRKRPTTRQKQDFEKERTRFACESTATSSVGFETMFTLKINHYMWPVKIWHFLGQFAILMSLSADI